MTWGQGDLGQGDLGQGDLVTRGLGAGAMVSPVTDGGRFEPVLNSPQRGKIIFLTILRKM